MNYRALLLSLLLLASSVAFAQGRRGMVIADRTGTITLSGVVHSLDGTPLPGVHVEIRQQRNSHVIASGYTLSNGAFELPNVPHGTFEVVATQGLQEVRQMVQVQELDVPLDIKMAGAPANADANSTVSVAQMQVPDKARKEFHKAEEAFRKHKADDARKHVEKSLAIAPTYAAALTLRGILDLGDNQFDRARSECEQAIRSDPDYGMGYIVLGAVYNSLTRFEDALRTLPRGLALLPQSWQGHFEMAKALLGQAHYEEALRQINQAGDLVSSSYPAIHLVRAHALLGLKKYSEAIRELEQYLGGAPNGVDAVSARETLDQTRAFAASRGPR